MKEKMRIEFFNGGKSAMIYFGRLGFVVSVPVSNREISFLEKEGVSKADLDVIIEKLGRREK